MNFHIFNFTSLLVLYSIMVANSAEFNSIFMEEVQMYEMSLPFIAADINRYATEHNMKLNEKKCSISQLLQVLCS